jgi:hypothetical protein
MLIIDFISIHENANVYSISPISRERTPDRETLPVMLLTHRRIARDRDGCILLPDAKGYLIDFAALKHDFSALQPEPAIILCISVGERFLSQFVFEFDESAPIVKAEIRAPHRDWNKRQRNKTTKPLLGINHPPRVPDSAKLMLDPLLEMVEHQARRRSCGTKKFQCAPPIPVTGRLPAFSN